MARWPCLHPAALLPLVLVSGCGSSTPTTPSRSSPPVQSIAIYGEYAMYVRNGQTLTATARLVDGSIETPVGATWSTSNIALANTSLTQDPALPAVGPNAPLRAFAPGLVTVFVDYRGQRGQASFKLVPKYWGTWRGAYVVETCSGTGSAEDTACRGALQPGTSLPITLTLTQNVETVSGLLAIGPTAGPVGGTLFINGWLKLAGRTEGGGMAMTLTAWDALSDGAHMPGSFSCAVTYDTLAGVAALGGSMLLTEGNPPGSD